MTLEVGQIAWRDRLPDYEDIVESTVRQTLAEVAPDRSEIELGVTLSDDDTVRALNRRWRDKDTATDVLSFPTLDLAPGDPLPAWPGPLPLGDVVLSLRTIERQASELGNPLEDHVRHLICHGVLHLLGHDHLEPDDADLMERIEASVLLGFGLPDPYGTRPEAVQ